jgi:predicted amidohydrolase YtcJ
MPEQPLKPVVVHAIIDNAYDGVIRFLADAQRIGLILDHLQVVSAAEDTATLNAVMSVPVGMDIGHLAVRFARHPSVRSASCAASPEGLGVDGPECLAA